MNNPNPRTPANILLVDDLPENIAVYEAILSPLGHTLVGVNSGGEALHEVLNKDFAAIIMDARMPDMDGYETATLIKKRSKSQHIPIIFVTASEDEPLLGYSVGAVDYIYKPVNPDVLRAKVNVFVELYNALKGMKEAKREVENARDGLEMRVAERTLDLEKMNTQLIAALDALKTNQGLLIKMEKMASLGQLSAGVAHELKNPLNIISTNIQMMRMDGGRPPEDMDVLGRMMEQVNRMVKIIDNLRDYARERPPEIKEIDVVDLIKKTVALVEYEMRAESINIDQRYCSASLSIKGDRDQLAQVFLNLLTNARYSMGEKKKAQSAGWKVGGKVWMGLLSISVEKEDRSAVIKFTDNGVGIPENQLKRIFDPFFTTKPEGRGTGLGLSISYGIIENHHGAIEAKSEEGEGATFTIRIPLG